MKKTLFLHVDGNIHVLQAEAFLLKPTRRYDMEHGVTFLCAFGVDVQRKELAAFHPVFDFLLRFHPVRSLIEVRILADCHCVEAKGELLHDVTAAVRFVRARGERIDSFRCLFPLVEPHKVPWGKLARQ